MDVCRSASRCRRARLNSNACITVRRGGGRGAIEHLPREMASTGCVARANSPIRYVVSSTGLLPTWIGLHCARPGDVKSWRPPRGRVPFRHVLRRHEGSLQHSSATREREWTRARQTSSVRHLALNIVNGCAEMHARRRCDLQKEAIGEQLCSPLWSKVGEIQQRRGARREPQGGRRGAERCAVRCGAGRCTVRCAAEECAR